MFHVGGNTYELLAENKDGWNLEAFRERYSDVLERYDYVVGDWGYNQLRLRGFFKEANAKGSKDFSFSTVQDYLNEYCNFGCAYFIIEKMNVKNARQANGELLPEHPLQNGGGGSEELQESSEGIVPKEWNSRGQKESRENQDAGRPKDPEREGRETPPREHIRDERHHQRAALKEPREQNRESREPRDRHQQPHDRHERQERQDRPQKGQHGHHSGKEHQSPKQRFQQGKEQHSSGKQQHANGQKQHPPRGQVSSGQPGKHQQRGQQPQPNSTTGRP
ncbi:YutD-like domain-containing protein [Paenibacillus sp. MBLB4367]|uniref:YutD family protein n=1 Tax=Paenibacillus sp. MBLB4367 TaxID=3384767 RepID=UPI0039084345